MKTSQIAEAFQEAKERYATAGIDLESILAQLQQLHLTLTCDADASTSTPRNTEQYRQDLVKAQSLIGGHHHCDALGKEGHIEDIYTYVKNAREAQLQWLKTMLNESDTEACWPVYDEFCRRNDVPVRDEYLADIDSYVEKATAL